MSTKAKIFLPILFTAVFVSVLFAAYSKKPPGQNPSAGKLTWWDIQSVDTMKYSRDLAREKNKDASFEGIIDTQVRLIADTGATHISIGTPYTEEFLPFLTRWVDAARKYNLKIWFRGNIPGWEGWFGYEIIDRETHIANTVEFILANGNLFEEGDIFSACPECENGGPGDPRITGDVSGHREFLIKEYKATNDAFRKIGKNVRSNFAPMNGDVANLIMDKDTTQALGGIVVIDHYVESEERLISDIQKIAEKSGGMVILGEFGAPIPDIHGNLTPDAQAEWVEGALSTLSGINELSGVNYWTSFGGSTRLWETDFEERPVVGVLKRYYKPNKLAGKVLNQAGDEIKGAKVSTNNKSSTTDKNGNFSILTVNEREDLKIEADTYYEYSFNAKIDQKTDIALIAKRESLLFKFRKFIFTVLQKK